MKREKSRIKDVLALDFVASMAALDDMLFLYGTQARSMPWATTEHTARYLRGIVPLQRMRAKRAKRRRR